MSTTPKKNSAQRTRYTDAQKKEIVDFVASYNATNGRGGQSEAVKKFKVSPISIGAWLKGTGAAAPKKAVKAAKVAKAPKAPKAPKAAKKAKAPKAAKAPKGKGNTRARYNAEQKKEVMDFVASYNAENGRGGQSKAAAKFKISPITVMAWLKAAGIKAAPKKGKKAPKAPKAVKAAKASSSGSFDAKLSSLLALSKEIAKAEAALAQLKGKFSSIKASL